MPVSVSDGTCPERKGSGPASQDIDDFIYLMSHDVRASVRALLELPQWIVEDLEEAGVDVSGSVGETIEMMNRHTARLDRMLVDLLAYSRIGRMQGMDLVDVDGALDEVLGVLTIPKGFHVSRNIACRYCLIGQQDILTLWSALIGNAVKHHHLSSGHITLATRAEGDMIRFTVCDDGPGIPEEFRAKVLGAMTTLRPRDEVEGSGMGLANIRKIAEHYSGTVSLSAAEPGQDGLRVDLLLRRGD